MDVPPTFLCNRTLRCDERHIGRRCDEVDDIGSGNRSKQRKNMNVHGRLLAMIEASKRKERGAQRTDMTNHLKRTANAYSGLL